MAIQLKPFDFNAAVARAGLRPDGLPIQTGPAAARASGAPAAPAVGFQRELQQALKSVSASQAQASQLQREVQLDNPTVSLEETMVAMQKSQIGFQAVLQVRNRMVQAYSDIMNMQV